MRTQEKSDLLNYCTPVLQYRRRSVDLPAYESKRYKLSYSQLKEGIFSTLKTLIKTASFVESQSQSEVLKKQYLHENKLIKAAALEEDSVVVYMKLAEFSLMKSLYPQSVLNLIESEVYKYIVDNREIYGFVSEKVFQLGEGEYAMVFNKSSVGKDMENFFQKLKQFQRTVQNRVLSVGRKRHYVSLLVSVAYDSEIALENARFGIVKLLKEQKDFFIAQKG